MAPPRDLSWIREWYFADFADPSVINTGWCFIWAWLAKLEHHGAVLYIFDDSDSLMSHAFVKIGRRYYDVERPRGVTKIVDLPYFTENFPEQSIPAYLLDRPSIDAFRRRWAWDHPREEWSQQGLKAWPDRLPGRTFDTEGRPLFTPSPEAPHAATLLDLQRADHSR